MLAIVALAAAASTGSRAQQEASHAFDPVGVQDGKGYFSQFPFENIDMINGNVILSFTDLVLPGNGGMAVRIVRTLSYATQGGPTWTIGLADVPVAIQGVVQPPQGPWNVNLLMADQSVHRAVHVIGEDQLLFDDVFMRLTWSTRTLELPNGWVATYETDSTVGEAELQEVHDAFGNAMTMHWLPRPSGFPLSTRIDQIALSGGTDPTREVDISYAPITSAFQFQSLSSEGRTWTYTWNTGDVHQLISAAPPAGSPWQFGYGSNELTVTTPNGGSIDYHFENQPFPDNSPRLSLVRRDVGGRGVPSGTYQFTYDRFSSAQNGRFVGGVDLADQRHLEFQQTQTTNDRYLLASKTLSRGSNLAKYVVTYSSCGDDSMQMLATRTITQDGRDYMTSYAYGSGNHCDFHRASAITEQGDLSRTTSMTYFYPSNAYRGDLVASQVVTVNGESFEKDFGYDSVGFLTSESDYGMPTTFGNDGAGNRASTTDANGHSTGYAYRYGVLKNTQTPEYLIAREINADGTVASETRNGHTTSFAYDGLGRVTLVSSPGRDVVTSSYGDASFTVSRGSSSTTTSLDGFARPVASVNSVGVSTVIEYDVNGQKHVQGYPSEGTASGSDTFEYDDLGRILQVTHSGGGTIQNTYSGTDVAMTDEDGHTTTQHWAAFGTPSDVRLDAVTDAKGNTWRYSYNALGSLTGVAPPEGSGRIWTYDGQNRVSSESHPESGTTTFTYDAVGNVRTKTDARGITFIYDYDGNNRLFAIHGIGTDDVGIHYDDADNRTLVENATVSTTFGYDAANRLQDRTDTIHPDAANPIAFHTHFDYDGRDNLYRII